MTFGEFLFHVTKRRRDKAESLHDILVAAREGLKKTKLMYATNLSWAPMFKLLKLAEARGLIEEVEAPPHQRHWKKGPTLVWKTTPKGLEYAKTVYDNYKMFYLELDE